MKTKVQLYTSEKAKQYRLDADMSLRYLGDCLNVSHTFIHDVEDPEKDQAYNLNHINELAVIHSALVRRRFAPAPRRSAAAGTARRRFR